MIVVRKYTAKDCFVHVNKYANFCHMEMVNGVLCLWFLVNTDHPIVARRVLGLGTNMEASTHPEVDEDTDLYDFEYIGSLTDHGEALVFDKEKIAEGYSNPPKLSKSFFISHWFVEKVS